MKNLIIAIDQSTSATKAMLFTAQCELLHRVNIAHEQFYPKPGWVEHDAEEIYQNTLKAIHELMDTAGIEQECSYSLAITNQRETVVVWNKNNGKPVYHAVVWQCMRGADYCNLLKEAGYSEMVQEKSGLLIDPYFSASGVKWILDNVKGAREAADNGDLLMGTIESWLIWKLTDGKRHVTDFTNASRTMLFNIHSLQWDEELLRIFDIPAAILPAVKPSSKIYGVTGQVIPDSRIPVAGIAGDQQAALFGQLCTQPGMVKNTYGTGCFMLMNTGEKAITSKNNLLTTIAWQINDKTEYALEGSVFIAGAVVQWLRDELKIIRSSGDVEKLALQVSDNGGVYLVPAFAGLGAPHWNQYARGAIFGLTRGSSNAHIAKAALESIAYQTYDVLKAMEADAGIQIRELRVDGGATVNSALMQFQSDILHCKVVRPEITETTALGAAYLAGLAVGFWKNVEEIQQQWQINQAFAPAMPEEKRNELVKGWQRAVKASIAWSSINSD